MRRAAVRTISARISRPRSRPLLSVFHLTDDLDPTGPAGQLARLAPALPRDRFRVEVGFLGRTEPPAADGLRRAGVVVHHLPVKYALDLRGLRRLRQAVAAAAPAVLHAWGPAAARLTPLLRRHAPKVIVSAAAERVCGLCGWMAVRATRGADRVVPVSWADAERYRRLGVSGDLLTLIGPCVVPPGPPPDPAAVRRELGLPPTARFVLAADRLEPAVGLKSAVWAFDILRYEAPDLYLVIAGDGPDRAGLEAFGRAIAFDDFRVRFAGSRSDLPELLALAEAVWVTRERGGVNLALAAQAAGRPVVGWRSPDLAEVVDDGVTGFLADPGGRAQLAAKTYPLVHEPGLADRVGAAGRAWVAARFGVARAVGQWARLYAEVVGSTFRRRGSHFRVGSLS